MRTLLVPLLALVIVPTATAAFSITLNTASAAFPGVTLNGVDQTQTLPLTITVVNTSSSNTTGWNVTAAAAAPTATAGTLSPLQVTAVSAGTCSPAGSCVAATNSIAVPVTLSATAAKIYNAAATTGKGTIVLTATLQMTYDAKALPATYSSTLTVAGTNSP
jgi:hypothetical protein